MGCRGWAAAATQVVVVNAHAPAVAPPLQRWRAVLRSTQHTCSGLLLWSREGLAVLAGRPSRVGAHHTKPRANPASTPAPWPALCRSPLPLRRPGSSWARRWSAGSSAPGGGGLAVGAAAAAAGAGMECRSTSCYTCLPALIRAPAAPLNHTAARGGIGAGTLLQWRR